MPSSNNNQISESAGTTEGTGYKTFGLTNGSVLEQVKADMHAAKAHHTNLLKTYKAGGKCLAPPSQSIAAPTFPSANGVKVGPIGVTDISNGASQLKLQLLANKASLGSSDWSNLDSSSASSGGGRIKSRTSRRYRKRKTKNNKKTKSRRSTRRRSVVGSRKGKSIRGGGKKTKRPSKRRTAAKSGKYITRGCFS